MKNTLEDLLRELTLEEKASLCSGKDFWTTKAIDRLGIVSWMITDGPHGLRKQKTDGAEVGLLDSVPATCFPSAVGLASSWNRELIEEVGRALGQESKAEQVGVILGPAVNIKRSPLCGRNFEYFSEDPYLAGQMAKHHILGVQSQGVGTSLKHFAANNQERYRMSIDVLVDERTLREIYLPAFETAVKEAQPWTVMCSYNRLNGVYASENPWLLTKVLKEEWGHQGVVVTDWGACNDRVAGLKAGQEFEMPGNGGITDAEIVAAVRDGTLSKTELDRSVRRVLELILKVQDNLVKKAGFDAQEHHRLARRAAAESMVLLKNDQGLLPLTAQKKIAFIGAFARQPRYQGGGSSHIAPTKLDDAVEEARRLAPKGVDLGFAQGYRLGTEASDSSLLAEARELARSAEVAVVFIGLTDALESEGFDRTHLGIPANHTALLEEVLKVQQNVVVVLSNGSPIEMPWIDRVPAVLEGYLGGQAWGGAVADLLFGLSNPSGKIAETFPLRLEDNSAYLNFPGERSKVEYREGIFVGYRHHDAVRVAPLFPFGHGLSYTTFAYGPLKTASEITETETLTVSLTVTNTGSRKGSEVVQLYVGDKESSVLRPVRELKGFSKVTLEPGQTKTVILNLDHRAFAFWSVSAQAWIVETGEFEIFAGSSSRDLRQTASVTVKSTSRDLHVWDQNACLLDIKETPVGKPFYEAFWPQIKNQFGRYEPGSPEALMMENLFAEMPLRNFVRMGRGSFTKEQLNDLLAKLNNT